MQKARLNRTCLSALIALLTVAFMATGMAHRTLSLKDLELQAFTAVFGLDVTVCGDEMEPDGGCKACRLMAGVDLPPKGFDLAKVSLTGRFAALLPKTQLLALLPVESVRAIRAPPFI